LLRWWKEERGIWVSFEVTPPRYCSRKGSKHRPGAGEIAWGIELVGKKGCNASEVLGTGSGGIWVSFKATPPRCCSRKKPGFGPKQQHQRGAKKRKRGDIEISFGPLKSNTAEVLFEKGDQTPKTC